MMYKTERLVDGLCFPEGPRWREGWLWFSDMHAPKVLRVDEKGQLEEVVTVPGRPSGLGWLPDGRLVIVSMTDRKLLTLEADGSLAEYADLGGVATHDCNDMVIDGKGRAYVGNFGSELVLPNPPAAASLALVTPDGVVREAAKDLLFPNGTVITPDGNTLIVGESFGERLTAFDIAPDGSLSNRRVFAQRKGVMPDGCCLDAAGGIWVASPFSGREVLRMVEGGEVTDRVSCQGDPFACMLGGSDGRTLFVCVAESADPEACIEQRAGAIEVAEVEIAHAGLP
jgi:sugar lactone lactonase YvrE